VVGEPIAVAYDGTGKVVVQTREPAMLHLASGAKVVLSTDSRADTGHTVFHANAGGFVACASCHAEGTEDGRVWTFACEGPRRTQTLAAGISGTEPFHWGGDMKSFSHLMENVFMGRMSGPKLAPEQMMATVSWIDRHPKAPQSPPVDAASIDRGRALFNDSAKVGCVTCHAGARYTNNQNADVGTGGRFQVPSLSDVGSRAPFMHDGCASTLAARFSPGCGGGDKHGVTSHLSTAQLADLMSFLESL
jgi:cytochrome c553